MLLLLLTALSLAADLDGTWSYDSKASDDIGPLLVARGVPWHMRALLGGLDRTLVMKVEDGVLHSETRTAVKNSSSQMILDGVARQQVTPKGDTVTVTHSLAGEQTVSVVRLALDDGSPATMTTRRVVGQDGVLRMSTTLVSDRGQTWAATEVYRRVEEVP